jgi:hypothetical protein
VSDHDRPDNLTVDELDRALRSLSATTAFPSAPDLTPGVLAGIAQRETRTIRFLPASRLRRGLAIAAILLIALAAALALSSGFRSAVADYLGIDGISITFSDKPMPGPLPAGSGNRGETLLLGESVTMDEANHRTAFPLEILPSAYGAPDEIYLRQNSGVAPIISFLYYSSDNLPNTAETGVGALLMEFQGTGSAGYIGKRVDGNIEWLDDLGDGDAVWIEGTHALTMISDPSMGCCGTERAAGNVLLWEKNGVIFRLESALPRDEAIALAREIVAQ